VWGAEFALLILQIEIFIAEPKKSTLSALLEVLKGAQDVGQISSALDSVISHAPHTSEGSILTYCFDILRNDKLILLFSESGEIHKVAAALIGAFFESHPKSFDVLERAAKATAELAKLDAGRGACAADANLITALTSVLDLNSQPSVQLQACRALGNICYENGTVFFCKNKQFKMFLFKNILDDGRELVLSQEKGLDTIIKLLSQAIKHEKQMKNVVAGFLHNLLAGQEETQKKALELGIVSILTDYLETDNEDDRPTHVLMILNLLADIDSELLDDRLCKGLVSLLGKTTSGEVSEMCLEIMLNQAENGLYFLWTLKSIFYIIFSAESVKTHLAKAGLCEQLNALAQKHKDLLQDDEARSLLKMACDLIVSVLTGDEAMELLYKDGNGQVFKDMTEWLSSNDEDLQSTAVLAMGNFARTGNIKFLAYCPCS
jgi:hypothetical protein